MRPTLIAILIIIGSPACAYFDGAKLHYDPHDTGNWVNVNFTEETPTGIDWYYFNSFNFARHYLVDTNWEYWRHKPTTPMD